MARPMEVPCATIHSGAWCAARRNSRALAAASKPVRSDRSAGATSRRLAAHDDDADLHEFLEERSDVDVERFDRDATHHREELGDELGPGSLLVEQLPHEGANGIECHEAYGIGIEEHSLAVELLVNHARCPPELHFEFTISKPRARPSFRAPTTKHSR